MPNFIVRNGQMLEGVDQMPLVQFLQARGLLHRQRLCVACNNPMVLHRDNQFFDNVSWQCGRPCRKKNNIRAGTFFENWKNVKLGVLIRIIFKWTLGPTAKMVAIELSLDRRLVERMFSLLRDCCTHKLQRNPITIGTANFVVQIDESMFHHKQRAHVGRVARDQVWVFGMVDTSFIPSKGYCQIVQNRTRATLTGVMNRVLNANSTVHSDMWRAYNNLPHYVPAVVHHDTVNHRYNFVNPATGAHTQNVESYWNRIKTWLKPKKGVRRDQLQSYLNEFIWKDHFGRTDPANPDRAFDEILVLISVDYPV